MTDTTSEARALLLALRDYASAARDASLEGLVRLKLTDAELRAIRLLLAEPGLAPRALASRLGISSPTVTLLVDRLERRGLIRRETESASSQLFATVETDEEPWASLDLFDHRAGEVAAAWSPEVVVAATELIGAMRSGAAPA